MAFLLNRVHVELMCVRKMVLRKALESDLMQVYSIEKESFIDPYPFWYIRFLFSLSGDFFYVAELGSKVVGYAILVPLTNRSCHLANIAVKREYRRRRIASCMLIKSEHDCRIKGFNKIVLEVETTNTPALLLYKKHGYKTVKLVLNYYGKDRHAYVMVKNLVLKPVS